MFLLALAGLYELGVWTLGAGAVASVVVASTLQQKTETTIVPMNNGFFHAGVFITPEEFRQPKYQKVREMMRNLDPTGLTPEQKEALAS